MILKIFSCMVLNKIITETEVQGRHHPSARHGRSSIELFKITETNN